MCSDCAEFEPVCGYCGLSCYGDCDAPDRCPSCWREFCIEEYNGDYELEVCLDEECVCDCGCHESDIDAWDTDPEEPAGLTKMREFWKARKNPKPQPGKFPFLKLPGEIRDKIYRYNMKQYNMHRKRSPYFKGTIETALLSTCRLINKEARHIPLSINTLFICKPFSCL